MKLFGLLAATLAVAMPLPALAQDAGIATSGETRGPRPSTEPLTAEQEARLPAAMALADKVVSPESIAEMLGGLFRIGTRSTDEDGAKQPLANLLGVFSRHLSGVDDERAARAATMLDPEWRLRQERQAEARRQLEIARMTAMVPTLRAALARLYVVQLMLLKYGTSRASFRLKAAEPTRVEALHL